MILTEVLIMNQYQMQLYKVNCRRIKESVFANGSF
uniref:Uncharacterized protein n=1 Tax=Rhizophora mucronata TaxID=61149 RepID=A0A2P2QYS2_RHIMU